MGSSPAPPDAPQQELTRAAPDPGDLARRKLCDLAGMHGRLLLDWPQRCEAMLRDLCPNERREIFLLAAALKEQIPAEIVASLDAVPDEVLGLKLTRKLCDHLGLAPDAAQWTVDSWMLAARVMASAKPVEPVAPATLPAIAIPVTQDVRPSPPVRAAGWIFLRGSVIACSIVSIWVVAVIALYHRWSTFGGWLAETVVLVAGLGIACFAQKWLAGRIGANQVPKFADRGRLAAAILLELLVLMVLPLVPVAAGSLWIVEWALELHVSGRSHDLSFQFGRILQSIPVSLFLFQWTRTMLGMQGVIASEMVRRP